MVIYENIDRIRKYCMKSSYQKYLKEIIKQYDALRLELEIWF